jgi:hypothetical protein
MSAAAKPLGAELLHHERLLDSLFAEHRVTPESLRTESGPL